MMTAALIVLGAVSYESLGLDLMPKTDSPGGRGAGAACPAPAPRKSRPRSPSGSRRPSTPSAASTSCAPPPIRASRGSTITFTLERDIESATQDVRDKVAHDRRPVPARHAGRCRSPRWIPTRRRFSGFAVFGPRAPRNSPRSPRNRSSRSSRPSRTSARSTLQRRAQARDPAAAQRRPPQRLRPDRRSGAHRGRAPERRDARAASSSPDPPKSRCARWAESRTSTTSTAIVIAYAPTARSSRSRDIGRVQDTVQEVRSATRLSGDPGDRRCRCESSRAPTPSKWSTACRRRLQRIRAHAARRTSQISVGNDQSRFIRRSFEDIKLHLILGGLLASVVVFLFIRNLRVTLHRRTRRSRPRSSAPSPS